MGLYSKYLLPRVVDRTCRARPNMRQRQKLVPLARGRVLEVGIGSGLNLPFYDPGAVTEVLGLDPSREMIQMATHAAEEAPFEVSFIPAGGEEIPLDEMSCDTVVLTYTLCSIRDYLPALREMARVLKPEGRLLFCEHGLAPDLSVRRWQNRLNPIWQRLGGGCQLNRDIPEMVRLGGFGIEKMETMYLPGWCPASFNYWGSATHR